MKKYELIKERLSDGMTIYYIEYNGWYVSGTVTLSCETALQSLTELTAKNSQSNEPKFKEILKTVLI